MAEVSISFKVTETQEYTWSGDVSDLPTYVYRYIDDDDPATWEDTITDRLDMDEVQNLINDSTIRYGDSEEDYEIQSITIEAPEPDDDEDQDEDDQDPQPTGGPVIPGRCPVCADIDCRCDCTSCTEARSRVATFGPSLTDAAAEMVSTVRTSARPF